MGDGGGDTETGVSEFPRLGRVNIFFSLHPCLQKCVHSTLHRGQTSITQQSSVGDSVPPNPGKKPILHLSLCQLQDLCFPHLSLPFPFIPSYPLSFLNPTEATSGGCELLVKNGTNFLPHHGVQGSRTQSGLSVLCGFFSGSRAFNLSFEFKTPPNCPGQKAWRPPFLPLSNNVRTEQDVVLCASAPPPKKPRSRLSLSPSKPREPLLQSLSAVP